MLQHIGHPAARGEPVYDITYENVQAGERTSHLFRLANHHDALVLGTGDLSELALGFTTYGVGDHMSHYNVNASVPKTLIRHLIRWLIGHAQFDAATVDGAARASRRRRSRRNSCRARATSRSNRRKPWSARTNCRTSISTTSAASAIARARSPTSRIAPGATRTTGAWPDTVPPGGAPRVRPADDHGLARGVPASLLPGQPVQALGHAQRTRRSARAARLSPRGDWRAPSDSPATAWLDELRANVPASARREVATNATALSDTATRARTCTGQP